MSILVQSFIALVQNIKSACVGSFDLCVDARPTKKSRIEYKGTPEYLTRVESALVALGVKVVSCINGVLTLDSKVANPHPLLDKLYTCQAWFGNIMYEIFCKNAQGRAGLENLDFKAQAMKWGEKLGNFVTKGDALYLAMSVQSVGNITYQDRDTGVIVSKSEALPFLAIPKPSVPNTQAVAGIENAITWRTVCVTKDGTHPATILRCRIGAPEAGAELTLI